MERLIIMNKSALHRLLFLALLALMAPACDHETDTFDGPNLVDRFGDFAVLTDLSISRTTVDFAAGETVVFTAELNKNIAWVIEITGTESGAVKRIEGFNRTINADNATWRGGTTDLPLFKDEVCTVELLVPEVPAFSSTGMVETLSSRTYEGSLFTDFENDLGVNAKVGNFEFEFTNRTGRQTDIPSQGSFYYRLEGTDNVVPNFFVGLVDFSSQVTGQPYAPLPTTVPEELYFNCFMYSDAGPHGLAIIDFYFDSDDDGVFDGEKDTSFRVPTDYDLATWDGWRQISHPMSETGISQAQLEKLVGIRLLLISNMNTQPNPPLQVDFGIDFMIFTAGKALEL